MKRRVQCPSLDDADKLTYHLIFLIKNRDLKDGGYSTQRREQFQDYFFSTHQSQTGGGGSQMHEVGSVERSPLAHWRGCRGKPAPNSSELPPPPALEAEALAC